MGDPRRAIGQKLVQHHRLLATAFYFAGFICVCIFPSFDRRTEIEEHGLTPGYAHPGFVGEWGQKLRAKVKELEGASGEVVDALDQALASAGLVAHHMNFTTPGGLKSRLVYTVASSIRGDSREAVVVVLAANWTAGKRALPRAALSLAIGTVLAEFLKTVQWLSKDVIFVFVDSSLPYGAGARAWLQAYFGGSSSIRRGVLRQAIVLDTQTNPTSFLIEAEGINGMVPNQDVVNTYMATTQSERLQSHHRDVFASVHYTFGNGGVHSNHAPFLESHVPAFTVRGRRASGEKAKDPEMLAQAIEALIRSMSSALQQLHHSFNFYFFTGDRSHISNGLYLYPVFAMQLPLLSFLWTTPAFRDIRSFLVGLGAIVATVIASGTPIFLLATNADLLEWLRAVAPAAAADLRAPVCLRPELDPDDVGLRRRRVAVWLTTGAAAAALVAVILRRYAFAVFKEKAKGEAVAKGEAAADGGVRLPSPLWDAVRCASGFASLMALAPITISSWAVAVPLTIVLVPVLILARPWSVRRRPVRSLTLLAFLAGNVFLLAVRPEVRKELLQGVPSQAAQSFYKFFWGTVLPAVPSTAHKYLPIPLVRWLASGQLGSALEGDLLLGVYEAARDFNCVGGMLFLVFCFVYVPLLALVALVGVVLPAQHVDDQGVSMRIVGLGLLGVLSILAAGVMGGIYWRSLSSHGLGELRW